MTANRQDPSAGKVRPWWQTIGPALITACVVFGPGSFLISANIGATYRCELLWMLAVTALLMGSYMTMSARIGVAGGATLCTLVTRHFGKIAGIIIGLNLCLVCTVFQFTNNLAVVAATKTLLPGLNSNWVLAGLNGAIIIFLFSAKGIYRILERTMKLMVAVILVCFAINLVIAHASLIEVVKGLIPSLPETFSWSIPEKINGTIHDPMLLIASLLGTTFSVAAAFYQGNLVREKGWTINDYNRGIGDSLVGVAVLTVISAVVMITTATVIPGQEATDIGMLAQSLKPLLGATTHVIFCVGLLAVAMNPFLINAMIGGSILADGIGLPARLSEKWPRRLTAMVLLIGMAVAMLSLRSGEKPVKLIIIGQALTVLGNPLMAATILWLVNNKKIMGQYRNKWIMNILGGAGLLIVIAMAIRVVCLLILKIR